jgi:hypothetical protein
MAIRPFHRRATTYLAASAALFLLASGRDAVAQGQRASAPLSVGATVVQTCTVEGVRVPALPGTASPTDRATPGPTYSIRCGKQTLNYPVPPGSQVGPLSKGAPVTVATTPDGRAYLVQF